MRAGFMKIASPAGNRLPFCCDFGQRSAMTVQAAQDAGFASAFHIPLGRKTEEQVCAAHDFRQRCCVGGLRIGSCPGTDDLDAAEFFPVMTRPFRTEAPATIAVPCSRVSDNDPYKGVSMAETSSPPRTCQRLPPRASCYVRAAMARCVDRS